MRRETSIEELAGLVRQRVSTGLTVFGTVSFRDRGYVLGSGFKVLGEYHFLDMTAIVNFSYDVLIKDKEKIRENCVEYFTDLVRPFKVEFSNKVVVVKR